MATDAEKNITATDTKNPEQQEFDKLEQNLTNTIEPIIEDNNSNSKLERTVTEMNTLDVLNDLYEVELSSDDMKIKYGIN